MTEPRSMTVPTTFATRRAERAARGELPPDPG